MCHIATVNNIIQYLDGEMCAYAHTVTILLIFISLSLKMKHIVYVFVLWRMFIPLMLT